MFLRNFIGPYVKKFRKSDYELGLLFEILRFMMLHKFSMGFKSGLLPGQSSV